MDQADPCSIFSRSPPGRLSQLSPSASVLHPGDASKRQSGRGGGRPLPPLTALGLSHLAAFEVTDANGITYLHTFFVREGLCADERLHFHELVHVIQWGLLGPELFLGLYADELEPYGYRDSPLEMMAYALADLFQKGTAPFSVEQALRRALELLPGFEGLARQPSGYGAHRQTSIQF